jgi:hypothetical protein
MHLRAAFILVGAYFLVVGQSSTSSLLQQRYTHPELHLTLNISKTTIPINSSTDMRIEFENIGSGPACLGFSYDQDWGLPDNLNLKIEDPQGKPVPLTDIQVHETQWSGWWIELEPGFYYGKTVYISAASSRFMKTPGKYRFSATFQGFAPTDKTKEPCTRGSEVFTGELKSNILELQILQE